MANGDPEVQPKRVSEKQYLRSSSRKGRGGDRVSDMRTGEHAINDGGKEEGEIRASSGEPEKRDAAPSKEESVRVEVNWLTIPVEEGEKLIVRFMQEIEKGRITLRDRVAAAAKADLRCSNPKCLKPLESEKSCVSIFTARDPKTQITRNIYSCSYACHSINNSNARSYRVIIT